MALTPAEKQKRYRERQKQAEKSAADLSHEFLRTPFVEAAAYELSQLDQFWDIIGIEGPVFEDDSGPKSLLGDYELTAAANGSEAFEGVPRNSLGRAEVMVNTLLDIAMLTAAAIKEYKLKEISARIAEIEEADLSDQDAKAKALNDIVVLRTIRSHLEGKTFRRSFSEFSVKGTAST